MQNAKRDASRSAGQRVGTSTRACATKTNGTTMESITTGGEAKGPRERKETKA